MNTHHFETQAVHAGSISDETAGSIAPPIYLSTTFERDEQGGIAPKGYLYTRLGNPNRQALETKIAALEQGAEGFAFSSGMAAMFALCQTVLPSESHILIPDDCYHGISHLVKRMLPAWKIDYTEVDMADVNTVKQAIRTNTKLIVIETPSNPLLKITDISAISQLASLKNIVTVCDNTWATPVITTPLTLGCDFVLHSTTKYMGGHSDVLGGCIVAREANDLSIKLRESQNIGGSAPSPFDCWLINRSLATLSLRVRQQCENAQAIANFLNTHPKIDMVLYPGLKSHAQYDVAQQQMRLPGGMLSILVKGNQSDALRLTSKLKLFKHATSLGGVESLIEHRLSVEGLHAKSPENLLRVSIGIEHVNDLIDDFKQALA